MSLAVKYRPKDFSSMVGQNFVKETLQEAVKQNKLVGAYLFCGPRGTGKTSTARILAKTINCLNPQNGNPCHKCEICTSFMDNKLIDIIEIDAASHTGVDNIRDIIEKAQFLPNKAKYKVYIIDEVHMLSTGAFNALLKILEEPPSFVKFILATTESHKIPETILSRCQRYDFKNINETDIKERLEFIAKGESIKIDDKSIDFIVKNSHGGLRNAITLFEQYVVNDEINFENIIENFGITETNFVNDFLNKLLNKDSSIISDFDKIIDSGKNIKLFFKDLIYLTRDRILENIKNNLSINDLNYVMMTLDETYSKTKNAMDEKITLLGGILKIITKDKDTSNEKIERKKEEKPLGNLENDQVSIPEKQPIKNSQELKNNEINSQTSNNSGLNHEDVLDVFGGITENNIENKSDLNFSKEQLILKIKDLGGKGSLTMGLRGGNVNFDGVTLHIKAPSKMALKSFQEAGSNEVILNAMEKLGFENSKIKID
nr:DNA polymerase III subunit gamma/tau [Candidatus Gracilibacteria bacterium]